MAHFAPGFRRLVDRSAGRLVHLLWLAGTLSAAIGAGAARDLTFAAVAGWSAAMLPGALGIALAGRTLMRRDAARFALTLAWTTPAIAASIVFGGALSPAAPLFLAGPAAMAASAGVAEVRVSAVTSATCFLLLAAASWFGPGGAGAGSALIAGAGPIVLYSGFLAACALVAGWRGTARLDQARTTVRRLKPAAEALEHAPAPLIACTREGEIAAASRSLRRLIPGAPRNLAGLPLSGFAIDEAEAGRVRSGLDSAGAGGSIDGGAFSFRVRGADGEPVALDVRAAPAGAGLVVHIDRDGAARARLEAERDEALASSRAKSEFLASVSHELRTPLNAIIGFSEVMSQRLFGPLPARYAEYADLIHESGRHLLDLIGDVLDMSKIEADKYELAPERFDARDVIETCAQMVRLRAEDRGLVLTTDIGEAALEVEADRKALRQILLNLLSNAIKFTPEGGAVAVMARVQGGDLVLAVGDSGVGIEPEALERIGKPYAQARSARESAERGTGLGLSLVRSLAGMHGGEMSVQSAPGEGTTVTVRLPVVAEAEIAPIQPLEVHERIRMAQEAGRDIATGDGAQLAS